MENSLIESIVYQDLSFAKVVSGTFFDINKLRDFDAVIVEYTNRRAVLDLVGSIRSHEDENIYLLPVYFYRFYRESNQNMEHFADGFLNDLSDLQDITDKTNEIKERI